MPYQLLVAFGVGLCAGCSIYTNAANNLLHEPFDYLHQQSLSHGLRKDAKAAWIAFAAEHPEWCNGEGHGDDFESGFIDGFADYLDNGGKGEPPAIPPKRYRKNKYLNPEGFQAIDRYFAGFAAGSRVAIDSGLRDTLVVPVLVPIPAEIPIPRPRPKESPHPVVLPMSPVIELPVPRAMPER